MIDLRVFAFVEDPGSANFVVGLRDGLQRLGAAFDLTAAEPALSYLAARGEKAWPWDGSHPALADATLLLVGTSENRDSSAFGMIEGARRQGIPSVAIIDAPSCIAERFTDVSSRRYRPDHLVCAQSETQAAARLVVHGKAHLIRHPYLDVLEVRRRQLDYQDRNAMRKTLFGPAAAGKIVLAFLTEISDGLDRADFVRCADYTLAGSGYSDKRTHVVLDELLLALTNGGRAAIHLVLRLHPKEEPSDYAAYHEKVDQVSCDEDPLEIVGLADIVVGMTTNLLSEAALMGAPVLSIVPRPCEQQWLAQMTDPPIPVVWTEAGLRLELHNLLGRQSIPRKRVDLDRPTLAECLVCIYQQRSGT